MRVQCRKVGEPRRVDGQHEPVGVGEQRDQVVGNLGLALEATMHLEREDDRVRRRLEPVCAFRFGAWGAASV